MPPDQQLLKNSLYGVRHSPDIMQKPASPPFRAAWGKPEQTGRSIGFPPFACIPSFPRHGHERVNAINVFGIQMVLRPDAHHALGQRLA